MTADGRSSKTRQAITDYQMRGYNTTTRTINITQNQLLDSACPGASGQLTHPEDNRATKGRLPKVGPASIALVGPASVDMATLVALIVTGFFSGGNRWSTYLQLPIGGWLTSNLGWLTLKSVDDWRTAHRGRPSANEGQKAKRDLD